MNLGLTQKPVATSERDSKKRGLGAAATSSNSVSQCTMAQATVQIAKRLLQTKSQVHKLSAAVFINSRISTDSTFVKQVKAAHEAFKEKRKEFTGAADTCAETIVIASFHMVNAAITWAIDMHQKANRTASVEALNKFCKEMEEAGEIMIKMGDLAPTCVAIPAFNKKLHKVEISLREPLLSIFNQHVFGLIKAEKAFRPMIGQAPRNNLQRQVQAIIDEMKEADES